MTCILIVGITLLLPKATKETYAASTTLADTVILLNQGSAWSSGASGVYQVNHTMQDGSIATDYRYIGANVNNYVSFNNDLYQIIGVFDENTHGVEGQKLMKIIPTNIISDYSWGAYNSSNTSGTYSSYKNDWTGNTTGIKANLNILLNEYFYNSTSTSSSYGECSTWTYFSNNTNYRTNDCSDIIGYGLDSTYKNYIQEATWYLYGYSGTGLTAGNFYLCERGQYEGCTSGNSGTYDTNTTANIGLMYISDYMYASSAYASTTTTTTGSSQYNGKNNWLYKGLEWTITPSSSFAAGAFSVYYYGDVNRSTSYRGYGVRPTFYLKSNITITGGTGTFDDPYTIAM